VGAEVIEGLPLFADVLASSSGDDVAVKTLV